MVLAVVPALIPDIPELYDIYFKAFDDDEMGRRIVEILFPQGITPEFKKAHAAGTLAYWHTSNTQFTFKCIDTENGEILGMGLADLVLNPPEKRENPGVQWLEGKERERAEKILNPLWEARDELIGGQSHIYVHVIAVDPKHQGRKAGALLCQYGIEQAERLQIPMYFESSPTTLGLYTKMGFVELEKHIVHKAEDLGTPTDITVPLCIRMPAAANGLSFEEWQAKGYPEFETKPIDTRILAKAASAAAGGADLIGLLENLTAACGGEKNLMALASMASTIGIDKLPGLLSLMGISAPEPAAAPAAAPKAEPAVVKPTETTVETTVEVAQP
ncbi:N-acetyltransferase domain-containing protein [Fusarium sp. LHS14.1]|nr:N-acetyltransferase domain-containing protein [Fusarium sp. LHS14.1]